MQGLLAPVFLCKRDLDAELEMRYRKQAVKSAANFQQQLTAASQELAIATAAMSTPLARRLLSWAAQASWAHKHCCSWRLQTSTGATLHSML